MEKGNDRGRKSLYPTFFISSWRYRFLGPSATCFCLVVASANSFWVPAKYIELQLACTLPHVPSTLPLIPHPSGGSEMLPCIKTHDSPPWVKNPCVCNPRKLGATAAWGKSFTNWIWELADQFLPPVTHRWIVWRWNYSYSPLEDTRPSNQACWIPSSGMLTKTLWIFSLFFSASFPCSLILFPLPYISQ